MQVEMFAVTADKTGCESDDALSDFVNIEQHLFEQLGLHFRFALSELDWLTVGWQMYFGVWTLLLLVLEKKTIECSCQKHRQLSYWCAVIGWCCKGSKAATSQISLTDQLLLLCFIEFLICRVKSLELLLTESMTWKLGCQERNSGAKYVVSFFTWKYWTAWKCTVLVYLFKYFTLQVKSAMSCIVVCKGVEWRGHSVLFCRYQVHQTAQTTKVVVLILRIKHGMVT